MSAEKINRDSSEAIKIALLEQAITGINQTLLRIESDLKENRKEFKAELSEDRKEVRMFFKWTMGSILGMYALMFYVVKIIH